jgi:hypothetical protein
MAHDDRRDVEAADDPLVVVDDLGDADPVEDGRVAADGLDLAFHAGPGGGDDLVSALLEARLPALPAARGEPETVDEDDGALGTHGGLLGGGGAERLSRSRPTTPGVLRVTP